MKKKFLYGVLTVVMCFVLVGCGCSKNNEGGKENGGNSNNGGTNNGANSGNEVVQYNYRDGVLQAIVDKEGNPLQTDFVINGLILVGNRHSYDDLEAGAEGIMTKLVAEGYKKDGLISSFYLNEWIEIYVDTNYAKSTDDVKIIAVPHKTVEEYQKLSLSKLEELANDNGGFVLDYKEPEIDNYKYVGNGYIHQDYPEGKYDLLFTYKGKLAYFVQMDLTKEPTE